MHGKKKKFNKLASLIHGYKCILSGGAALPFYGADHGTVDIDLEIQNAGYEQIEKINTQIEAAGIEADVTGDSSGWGMIPLPSGYRDRVIEIEIPGLSILDPIDFILSKMRRGIERDLTDSIEVAKTQKVTREDIEGRLKLVDLPADPVTEIYNRRLEIFYKALKNI